MQRDRIDGRSVSHHRPCRRLLRLITLSGVAMLVYCVGAPATAEETGTAPTIIESRPVHLRNQTEREWSSFPEIPEGTRLTRTFRAMKNDSAHCLLVRQEDVRQQWVVALNGKRLGELVRDENEMTIGMEIPPQAILDGENVLLIETSSSAKTPSDDIRVGPIKRYARPLNDLLTEATLDVTVIDRDSNEAIPSRITVTDADESLITFGTPSSDTLAVRAGTAFTSTGTVHLKLPAGKYTVYAGRGFEYSLARTTVTIQPGDVKSERMSIRREVPTPGYVACDTHFHTLTHSGHGDATIAERMVTLAGEAIELPIATDHNVQIDCEPIARQLGVRRYFTPVIGNEVTTPRGHFNIFPVRSDATPPNYKQLDWKLLFDEIHRTPDVKVVVLNHARDLHSGVRPFGPALHNALVGENLEGWPIGFNAMEVVNSGATQTDVMRLFHDWMGLLNRGHRVTPVGSSDSHDVVRYFAGQGRTYVRCADDDPGKIDVAAAMESLQQGRVMVSYGLLAEMQVDRDFTSGDLVPARGDFVTIHVRVLGPAWTSARRVMLFANGVLLKDVAVPSRRLDDFPAGVKWTGGWKIRRPRHDVHLVAIAVGPGVDGLYWRTAKPYQPQSLAAQTSVVGCSGTVWVDADGDGRFTSAHDYAKRLIAEHQQDLEKIIRGLAEFDESTAVHVAHQLQASGINLQDEHVQSLIKPAPAAVQTGFRRYQDSWRETVAARLNP